MADPQQSLSNPVKHRGWHDPVPPPPNYEQLTYNQAVQLHERRKTMQDEDTAATQAPHQQTIFRPGDKLPTRMAGEILIADKHNNAIAKPDGSTKFYAHDVLPQSMHGAVHVPENDNFGARENGIFLRIHERAENHFVPTKDPEFGESDGDTYWSGDVTRGFSKHEKPQELPASRHTEFWAGSYLPARMAGSIDVCRENGEISAGLRCGQLLPLDMLGVVYVPTIEPHSEFRTVIPSYAPRERQTKQHTTLKIDSLKSGIDASQLEELAQKFMGMGVKISQLNGNESTATDERPDPDIELGDPEPEAEPSELQENLDQTVDSILHVIRPSATTITLLDPKFEAVVKVVIKAQLIAYSARAIRSYRKKNANT